MKKKWENKIDNFIINFVTKRLNILFIVAISILAITIRYMFRDVRSSDYNIYVSNWGAYFMENGGLLAIKSINSDYNVPYLYILAGLSYLPVNFLYAVKAVSILFDFGIAVIAYKIVNKILQGKPNARFMAVIVYSVVLFIPTVIINSSSWAQCDSIYVFFVMLSVYLLISDRHCMSFLAFGIALDFKLQAIFIFPLYIVMYFKRRNFSFVNFFCIPLVMFIVYIPAWLLGRPLNMLWNIYFHQVDEYQSMTMNFPNIYSLLKLDISFKQPGIIFTIFIIGLIAAMIIQSKRKLTDQGIIELSLLLVVIITYFLPAMHDRYMYMADILSIVYVVLKGKNIIVPIIIISASFNSYLSFLSGEANSIPLNIVAVLQLYIILKIAKDFINDNLRTKDIIIKEEYSLFI